MTEDGIYIVKAGETYKITPKIEIPFAKRVNIMTGEIYYPSNADRIRAMSDEELADYHTEMCGCPPGHDPIFCGMATIGCKGCWLSWLKSPVEEVDNG